MTSYSGVLDALARLHAEPRFRAGFLSDPAAALASLGLPEPEREALARLDRASVERIARLMEYHRLTRAGEHLAWLDVRRRPDLRTHLARFLTEVPPQLLNRDEAIALCRHIEAAPPGEPPYLGELARYDRRRIEIAWMLGGERAGWEEFQYPVLDILEAVRREPGWPAAQPRRTWIELRKVPSLPAVIARPRPGPPP